MLVIPTIDDQSRDVRLEVSLMENGCIKFAINGDYAGADAILSDNERKELVRWLS